IRTDNAKDYFNQSLSFFFQSKGFIHESSCVYTPQKNDLVERKNSHSYITFFINNMPEFFLGEGLLTSAYLINGLPTKTSSSKSSTTGPQTFYPSSKAFTFEQNCVDALIYLHGCKLFLKLTFLPKKPGSLTSTLHQPKNALFFPELDLNPSSSMSESALEPSQDLSLDHENLSRPPDIYPQSGHKLVNPWSIYHLLIYLSHIDIDYVVIVISQFMHDPRETFTNVVYWVLHYLKGNPEKGILFKKETN
ncbi:hypothetical protein V2J09_022185, partial [Rumex salicifolius]